MAKPNTVEDLGYTETAPAPEPRRRKQAAPAAQPTTVQVEGEIPSPEVEFGTDLSKLFPLMTYMGNAPEPRDRAARIAFRAKHNRLRAHVFKLQQVPVGGPLTANQHAEIAAARRSNVAGKVGAILSSVLKR